MPRAGSAYAADNGIARSYDSVDGLLADPAVDIVYISTTNELHRAQTLAAAAAGKHVLCEKPLALAVADAQRDGGGLPGRRRGDGHQPPSAQCRQPPGDARTRSPPGGSAGHCSPACSTRSTCRPHLQGWRITTPGAGGGVILDITVHDADTLRFVLGDDPVEAVAMSQSAGMAVGRARGRRRWACCASAPGSLAQLHDAFTTTFAGTGFEVHGTEGSLVGPGRDDPAAGRRGRAAHRRRRGGAAGRRRRSSTTARCASSMPRCAARASRRRPARTASGRWRPASPCATRRPAAGRSRSTIGG